MSRIGWIWPMGVSVKVKPCTSAVFYEAKAYMNAKLAELARVYQANKEAGVASDTDIENPIKREALADRFLLVGLGVPVFWSGVAFWKPKAINWQS